MRKLNNHKKGFTLIEMMVAITIFVLVAFTITATLIAVSNANRKAQEVKQVMDNLNFSIQSMVLRMREGTEYTCYDKGQNDPDYPTTGGQDCGDDGGNAIVFYDPTLPINGTLTRVRYFLSSDSATGHRIIKSESAGFGAGEHTITSPEVDIDPDGFRFIVGGVDSTVNGNKPFVIIQVSGKAKLRSGGETEFNLQTFVSQRN